MLVDIRLSSYLSNIKSLRKVYTNKSYDLARYVKEKGLRGLGELELLSFQNGSNGRLGVMNTCTGEKEYHSSHSILYYDGSCIDILCRDNIISIDNYIKDLMMFNNHLNLRMSITDCSEETLGLVLGKLRKL